MNEFEQQIHQLIAEACHYPRGSLERQKKLNQIVSRIQNSNKLLKNFDLNRFDYEEALQQTWVYFCHNLCETFTGQAYNPEKASIITWLNAYLKYRIKDLVVQRRQEDNARIYPQETETGKLIDPLENLSVSPADSSCLLEEIKNWLEKEKKTFCRLHLRNYPEINGYLLILRRLPPETSWKELSQEFGVPIATLCNFYQRKCFPLLLEFGKVRGYLH